MSTLKRLAYQQHIDKTYEKIINPHGSPYIYHGIAYQDASGAWHMGCDIEHFSDRRVING